MPRNVTHDKLVRELADFEAENCEHATAQKIRERMKAARAARGVPTPENFAEHFGCVRCCVAFVEKKMSEARREGLQDAIKALVEHVASSGEAAEEEEGG